MQSRRPDSCTAIFDVSKRREQNCVEIHIRMSHGTTFKVGRLDEESKMPSKNTKDDFSEYMWMADMENFDREVQSAMEEEDYIRSSIEELLFDEEERETVHFNGNDKTFPTDQDYIHNEMPPHQAQRQISDWGLAHGMRQLHFQQPHQLNPRQQMFHYQNINNVYGDGVHDGWQQPQGYHNRAILDHQPLFQQQNGYPDVPPDQDAYYTNANRINNHQHGPLLNGHSENVPKMGLGFRLNPDAKEFIPGGNR